MVRIPTRLLALLAITSLPVAVTAQPLCELPITAYLSDSDGAALTGASDVELRFYLDDSPAALPVECRTQTAVPIVDGWLRVMVDTCADPTPDACGTAPLTSVLASATDGSGLWVGIVVGEGDELEPRIAVGAVPFAVRASDSQLLDGNTADAFEPAGSVASHAADADAHHPADSAGIAIRPTSVTVGATEVLDGELDLGPDADDAITAEIARTLTGGGNADALHEHAGDSHGGGTCYTAFGETACGEGFTVMYTGLLTFPALFATGYNQASTSSVFCMSSTSIASTSSGLPYWNSGMLAGVRNGETSVSTVDDEPAPCAVCCR